MFENIIKFFNKFIKKEEKEVPNSKDAAKERLHLVLMQDRANVSADFLELMKQEIIEVIKKYIDVDERAIDVRLTNKENEDGSNGAPSLYANIPILNIKNEARKVDKVENKEEIKETKKEEQKEKLEDSTENKEPQEEKEEKETEKQQEEKSKEQNEDVINEESKKEVKDDKEEIKVEELNENEEETKKADEDKEEKIVKQKSKRGRTKKVKSK